MNWQIDLHSRALRFLEVNKISQNEIIEIIKKTLKKFQGEDVNIDIVKIKGKWLGFHRIKIGKLRIIAEFNFERKRVYVEVIDWRGSAYK
ncbi:MAG: hypothetical protein KY055_00195 [Candidatus Nealsonbacteria bacterium]|nr:hypothetical protein [Candidatus Nealsonbacteria bacterium]